MLTVSDLDRKRREKATRNHEIYKGFFYEISEKIKSRDRIGFKNLIHRVPTMVFGFPIYDVNHAILYLIQKLQKGGFFVYPWKDNYLYIDWSVKQTQSSQPISTINTSKSVSFTDDEIDDKIRQIGSY